MAERSAASFHVRKVTPTGTSDTTDMLAVEEPLEIRIISGPDRAEKPVSITMRTPGNDEELAVGFLFTENILKDKSAIHGVTATGNSVTVALSPDVTPALNKLDRNFYTTSSCGVCGKASLDAVTVTSAFGPAHDRFTVTSELLHSLQEKLQGHQRVFELTGGLHASALFDPKGNLLMVREDVGRHNALDKLVGTSLLENKLPLEDSMLLLSGRISFELVQKASMAGIPLIAAIGAPSSLAVTLAEAQRITLVGFLRNNRFTVYTGKQRIG